MKLEKVIISGFRSVATSETLLVDNKATVLIGANDHGKSNILAAIQCLNDESPISAEDRNWDLSATGEPSIEWHFTLTPQDMERMVSLRDTDQTPAGELVEMAHNRENHLVLRREGADQPVTTVSVPIPMMPASFDSQVAAMRPRVELFTAPSANMQDSTSLAELQDDLVMQGIFRLAGLWEDREEIFSKSNVTSKKLDQASDRLTEALKDTWNQGKDLVWKLKHNGDRIDIEINDPSISTRYSRPSLRSSGFRTYFLLSMITSAKTADNPDNPYIFLFDEPGTYLHPHAQIDLQRTFENISTRSQIVYTTHSLFLVSKNYPGRNRVVAKTVSGTRIDQKPFQKNWKSVRDCLGILMSNNFLIAEKTLLVEGPSDIVYILSAISRLKSLGQADIDLNDLSVVDAGSSENYIAMAKLMLSEGRSVVALVDGDKAGDEYVKKLQKACAAEIKKKQLIAFALPRGKSIEDIFVNLECLQNAAVFVGNEVCKQGIRSLADGIDLDAEKSKIVQAPEITLGWTLDQVTKAWFAPAEKLSKLSIALQYDDATRGQELDLPNDAMECVAQIKKLLGIRGEMAAEEGVFEEV